MLSIVLIILIWTTSLMPMWANIVCTILLGIRFSVKGILGMSKFLGKVKGKREDKEDEIYKN
jgi:hypothetical protein